MEFKMTRKYRPITESEKQYILQNYKTKHVTEIANNMNRSRVFVLNFLIKNKLKPLERYPRIYGLTENGHKVMSLVAQGYSKSDICKKMFINIFFNLYTTHVRACACVHLNGNIQIHTNVYSCIHLYTNVYTCIEMYTSCTNCMQKYADVYKVCTCILVHNPVAPNGTHWV